MSERFDGRSSDLTLGWLTLKHGQQWEEWRVFASEWISRQDSAVSGKLDALTLFLETYLTKTAPWASSICIFFEGYGGISCSEDSFKKAVLQGTRREDGASLAQAVNYIVDFLDWCLDTHFSEPNDNGHLIRVWNNPFSKVKPKGRRPETVYNPLPFKYICAARAILCPKPNGDFKDWKWAHMQTGQSSQGQDGDWFDVALEAIDKSDPDCIWRIKHRSRKEATYQIWSPVRAMVLLIKLHLPLRTYQVRMLDSGEADTWRYNQGQWHENTKHAFVMGSQQRPYARGVFRRIYDGATGKYSTGLYISTNKTADQNKNNMEWGYTIPWQNAEVLYWLEKLRNWQEKYNPIQQPTDCLSLQLKHTNSIKSDQALSLMGSMCFLFRNASAKNPDCGKPIGDNQIDRLWYLLLQELEKQLFDQGDILSNGERLKLVKGYSDEIPEGQRSATLFPLHCLRVSLITCYAMDGKIPLPVVSKLLAGHSRILMTLYYIKLTPSVMTEKMDEAEKELKAQESSLLRAFLKEASLSQVQSQTAFQDSASINSALTNHNPLGWQNKYIGLCLVGGSSNNFDNSPILGGCFNGGKVIASRGHSRSIHGPTPHGPENCVRCRWFLTDSRYLTALNAHLNFMSYKASEAASLAVTLEAEIEEMTEKKYVFEEQGKAFTLVNDLQQLQRRYEKQTIEADEYTKDWIATFQLIFRIIEIEQQRQEGEAKNKLIAVGTEEDLKISFTETSSKLLQLSLICDDAEYYPDLKDDVIKTSVIQERTMALSQFVIKAGYQPNFLLMDSEQQLIATNGMMRQMALMMDKDNKLEGFRKAVNYLEMEQYMSDEGLLKQGLKALSGYYKQPILKLVNGKLIDINEDKSHVH